MRRRALYSGGDTLPSGLVSKYTFINGSLLDTEGLLGATLANSGCSQVVGADGVANSAFARTANPNVLYYTPATATFTPYFATTRIVNMLCWFKTSSASDGVFINLRQVGSVGLHGLYYSGGIINYLFSSGIFSTGVAVKSDGLYHHYELPFNRGGSGSGPTVVTLRIDGIIVFSETRTGDGLWTTYITELVLLANVGGGSTGKIGSIDNVRLYNRELTADERIKIITEFL